MKPGRLGWLYNLDGRLRAMIAEKSFQGADKADFGLKPLEMEIFLGFVFIRFEGGEAFDIDFVDYH